MTIILVIAVVALHAAGAVIGWRSGGPRDAPLDPATPVRLALATYLVMYGLGSVVLAATGESGGAGPLLSGAGVLAFGTGSWLASRLAGDRPRMPAAIGTGPVSWPVVLLLAVVGMAALGTITVRYGLPFLTGDAQLSRSGFGGLTFDVFRWLVPPAALALLGLALARRDGRTMLVAGIALLAVGGLELLLASRALPFELALSALLIGWWAGRRLSRAAWGGIALCAVVLFVGVQLARVSSERGFRDPADVVAFSVSRTVDRVLLIHPRTLEVAASTIPSQEPYFGGSTYIRWLDRLTGGDDRPALGYWLYDRMFPAQPGGFAAPGLLGEAWANGGPILSSALMLALGFAANLLWGGLVRSGRGPGDRVLAALVTVAIARSYATSLNGLILTLGAAAVWWLLVTGVDRLGRGRASRASRTS